MDDSDRFHAEVMAELEQADSARARLRRLTDYTDGCWLFRGHIDGIGYGRLPALGENKAHRVSWIVHRGRIPFGMNVLHKCDVRNCVNPDHLWLGTQAENVRDMYSKGRNRVVALHGERNPMARLTRTQVDEIRAMVAAGAKQRDACKKFNVSPMTVSRIVRGEAWK